MPPPPPPKRIKRPATVLDEDIYTNALSHIIARDFFPGLLETQIKQEYLDALDSKDRAWIAAARKKLTDVMMTPARARGSSSSRRASSVPPVPPGQSDQTPAGWGGDTPMSTVSAATQSTTTTTTTTTTAQKEIPDVSNLGLVAFQAKYTSEDNESFNKLLDKQNAKRREKYAWLWSGNKIPSARQLAHQQRETKRIAAQGGNPNKQQEQQLIKTDLDARPAKPDTWKVRPENALMFIPSSVEDTHETVQQRAEASSRAGPKRVLYHNTRIQEPGTVLQEEHASVPPSPSISAIKDAIAGRPRPTESEAGCYTGGETPRVNGYAFVDEEEPEPGSNDGPSLLEDLRLLGTGDTTPNPFKIRENRKREELHHRMVDRVARTKRAEKAGREIKTPVPRFPSSPMLDYGLRSPATAGGSSGNGGNVKTLTPAAQKLLRKVGSTPRSSGLAASSSSGLRNMWTPTPKRAK